MRFIQKFDGESGIRPHVTQTPDQRNSKNCTKGTLFTMEDPQNMVLFYGYTDNATENGDTENAFKKYCKQFAKTGHGNPKGHYLCNWIT